MTDLPTKEKISTRHALRLKAESPTGYYEFYPSEQRIVWSEEIYKIFDLNPTTDPPSIDEQLSYFEESAVHELREKVAGAIEGMKSYDIILDLRTRGGEQKKVRLIGIPELYEGEHILIGLIQDITNVVNLSTSLQEANLVIEQLSTAVIYFNGRQEIRYCNKAAEYMLGAQRSTLIGSYTSEVFVRLCSEGTMVPLSELVGASKHLRLNNGVQQFDVELDTHALHTSGVDGSLITLRDVSLQKQVGLALENERSLMDIASEAANMGVWRFNTSNETGLVNDNWARMLGYEPYEIADAYRFLLEHIHPDDGQMLEERIKGLGADVRALSCEIRIMTKAGVYKWFLHQGRIISSADGGVETVGIHLDIDLIKKEQRRSQGLVDIVNHSQNALAVFNLEGTKLHFANPSFTKRLMHHEGHQPDLFEVLERFDPEYVKALVAVLVEGQCKQQSFAFEKDASYFESNLQIIDFEGSASLLLVAVDATERREHLVKLRQLESEQEALMNNVADIMWSVDADLRLQSANRRFLQVSEEWFGKQLNIGDRLIEVQDQSDENDWRTYYYNALKGKSEEFTAQHRNGEQHMNYRLSPIIDHRGDITGVACMARDVTEMVNQAIRLERNNEELKELSWVQSHVVREPVAKLLGLIDLLMLDSSDQKTTKMIKIVAKDIDKIIRYSVEKANELRGISSRRQ